MLIPQRWEIFSNICFSIPYKTLRVQTFAGNIKAVPPVSPLLILNKLDIDSFCDLSNRLTNFLLSNSYINLTVFKNRYADFLIDVKQIPLGDFLKWMLSKRRLFARLKQKKKTIFFCFFLLSYFLHSGFFYKNIWFFSSFFGSLWSATRWFGWRWVFNFSFIFKYFLWFLYFFFIKFRIFIFSWKRCNYVKYFNQYKYFILYN